MVMRRDVEERAESEITEGEWALRGAVGRRWRVGFGAQVV